MPNSEVLFRHERPAHSTPALASNDVVARVHPTWSLASPAMAGDAEDRGDVHKDQLAREAARLHYEQGLETAVIGRRFGCSARRVRDLIRYAREEGLVAIGVS